MSMLQGIRTKKDIETAASRSNHLIINGDDFGLSSEVNKGIILAYREGVLRSASLMMGEPSTAEAVELAKQNPGLAIGLHIALSDAHPVLPPERIPELVQADGRFHPDEATIRRRLFQSLTARRQLRAEIAAQVAAFRSTGLSCDHVNTHRNVHLHPVIAVAVFQAAARAGVSAVRIPWQPRMGDLVWHRRASASLNALRYLRVLALRRLAALYRLRSPDWCIDGTGQTANLHSFLKAVPPGVSEIYLHPATADVFRGSCPDFPYLADLATLRNPAILNLAARLPLSGYSAAMRGEDASSRLRPSTLLLRGID